jgi:hypothetical protein
LDERIGLFFGHPFRPGKEELTVYHLRNLAVVDLGVIQKNFLVLSEQAQTDFLNYHGLVAMVKANAYGHDLGFAQLMK